MFLEIFNVNAKPTSSFAFWLLPAWKTYSLPVGSGAIFLPRVSKQKDKGLYATESRVGDGKQLSP